MPWIESHTTLRTHKKLKLLCDELGLSRRDGLGLVHCFWWWTMENREDGDLSGLFDKDLAIACDWDGDSKVLIKALYKCGFIDKETNFVHDWLDYAAKFLIKKYSTRKKALLVSIWKKHGRIYGGEDLNRNQHEDHLVDLHGDLQSDPGKHTKVVNGNTPLRTSTKPNLTKPDLKINKTKTVFDFEEEQKVKNLLLFQRKIPEESEAFQQNFKEICHMAATKEKPYEWAMDYLNREIKAAESKKKFDGLVEEIVNKDKMYIDEQWGYTVKQTKDIEDILVHDFGCKKFPDLQTKSMIRSFWVEAKNQENPFEYTIGVLKREYETSGPKP